MSFLPQVPITHDMPIMLIDDDIRLERMITETLYLEGYPVAPMVIPLTGAAQMTKVVLGALGQADRPTIILADPTTFWIPGTEPLTAYLQDEAQRHPHLLYLMTALPEEDAAGAVAWLHADSRIAMPLALDALLALLDEAERILRDRAATPLDPFTLDC